MNRLTGTLPWLSRLPRETCTEPGRKFCTASVNPAGCNSTTAVLKLLMTGCACPVKKPVVV